MLKLRQLLLAVVLLYVGLWGHSRRRRRGREDGQFGTMVPMIPKPGFTIGEVQDGPVCLGLVGTASVKYSIIEHNSSACWAEQRGCAELPVLAGRGSTLGAEDKLRAPVFRVDGDEGNEDVQAVAFDRAGGETTERRKRAPRQKVGAMRGARDGGSRERKRHETTSHHGR